MQVNKDALFEATHRRHTDDNVKWYVTGTTECPATDRLVVKKFTSRSVVFTDVNTEKQYYTSLKIGNKILMAQQGLYNGPFMCVQKHSTDNREITWIGEVVY